MSLNKYHDFQVLYFSCICKKLWQKLNKRSCLNWPQNEFYKNWFNFDLQVNLFIVSFFLEKTTNPNATVVNTIIENLERIVFSNISINKNVATDLLGVVNAFLSSDTNTGI